MFFTEETIDTVVTKVRDKKIAICNLTFHFLSRNKKLLVHVNGHPSTTHDDEYIATFSDNLEYIQHAWLNTLINQFNTDAIITVNCDLDGSLSKKISIELKYGCNHRNILNWCHFMIGNLKSIVPFSEHCKLLRASVNDEKLTNIFIDIEVEGKDINAILREGIDQSILEHWTGTLIELERIVRNEEYLKLEFPIHKGKIHVLSRSETVMFQL